MNDYRKSMNEKVLGPLIYTISFGYKYNLGIEILQIMQLSVKNLMKQFLT